jgi:hypothetical protein
MSNVLQILFELKQYAERHGGKKYIRLARRRPDLRRLRRLIRCLTELGLFLAVDGRYYINAELFKTLTPQEIVDLCRRRRGDS